MTPSVAAAAVNVGGVNADDNVAALSAAKAEAAASASALKASLGGIGGLFFLMLCATVALYLYSRAAHRKRMSATFSSMPSAAHSQMEQHQQLAGYAPTVNPLTGASVMRSNGGQDESKGGAELGVVNEEEEEEEEGEWERVEENGEVWFVSHKSGASAWELPLGVEVYFQKPRHHDVA
jgi:hypothetical protein